MYFDVHYYHIIIVKLLESIIKNLSSITQFGIIQWEMGRRELVKIEWDKCLHIRFFSEVSLTKITIHLFLLGNHSFFL